MLAKQLLYHLSPVPRSFFALVVFQRRPHIFARLALGYDASTFASQLALTRGTHHSR
jgi:hypothetical protein